MEHTLVLLHKDSEYGFTLRIWQNPPSVVIGRGQNLEKEVNLEFCEKNNIVIGRRISGGGAVYQDYGNLNISFFIDRSSIDHSITLKELKSQLTLVLVDSLNRIGIDDCVGVNNNILYKEKKISGSAGYMYKNFYLHHATLLISVDLEKMEKALLIKSTIKEDSRSSSYLPTTNLLNLDVSRWENSLLDEIETKFNFHLVEENLSSKEVELASELANSYAQSEWIIQGKRNF